MNTFAVIINGFLDQEEGASATEYAIMIVLIILVAIVAIALLGGEVRSAFETFLNLLDGST